MVTNSYTCNANSYMEAKTLITSFSVNLKKNVEQIQTLNSVNK